MPSFLRGPQRYSQATSVFFVFWVSAWVLTVLTWQKDAAGYSIGMAFIALPLHLILPVLLGALIALYRRDERGGYVKHCAIIGLFFGLLQFGVLALVDYLWLPAPEVGQSLADLVAGTMVGAVLYGAYSSVLGALGGWLFAALSRAIVGGGDSSV